MAKHFDQILNPQEIDELIAYVATPDDRTDNRPDVRSKHPRWNQDVWPQHIIQGAMDKLFPGGYNIEEITFQDTKIALKPHTDNGSMPGTSGKTIMFTLWADPVAHTVYFKNYWTGWEHSGVFFTRTPWTPYQYKIPNRQGDLVKVEDIRKLLQQCQQHPDSVTEFDVTAEFISTLEDVIHKRSLPRLAYQDQNLKTGYIQPGPRRNDYETLTNYDPAGKFDTVFHETYLSDIAIEDLHGLAVESVITWQPGGAHVFNREQLHCSSSCHTRKIFCTIFYHESADSTKHFQ